MSTEFQADTETGKRRIALLTAFDGSAFCGWQIQEGQPSVQQAMRDVLIRLTGEENVQLTGCSRTDSGVHARAHVSHFDSATRIPMNRLPQAMNAFLPTAVAVRAAREVAPDFHARFQAKGKIYRYRIWHDPIRPALMRAFAVHLPGPLDRGAMAEAAALLPGRRDFAAFRDAGGTVRSTTRTLWRCELDFAGPLITLTVEGDGFLYHMVRVIAGSLVAVGQGKMTPADLLRVLASGDRALAGQTMPPQGLCLENVRYEPDLFPGLGDTDSVY